MGNYGKVLDMIDPKLHWVERKNGYAYTAQVVEDGRRILVGIFDTQIDAMTHATKLMQDGKITKPYWAKWTWRNFKKYQHEAYNRFFLKL